MDFTVQEINIAAGVARGYRHSIAEPAPHVVRNGKPHPFKAYCLGAGGQHLDQLIDAMVLIARHEAARIGATPETHELVWREKPEIREIESLALQAYMRLAFVPHEQNAPPT